MRIQATKAVSLVPALKGRRSDGELRLAVVRLLKASIAMALSVCGSFALARDSADVEQAVDAAIDRAVQKVAPRVVQLRFFGGGSDSLGVAAAPVTGYALDEHWVLTSTYGLGKDPAGIVCRFADGSQSQARVIARDHSRQIALLGVEAAAAEPPKIGGRRARVGETAIALGRVYAADAVNVAVGVVSAVDRLGSRAVQTDALISPVNYGGPLVGLDGELLGVITPLGPPGQSGVELYDSGVGFAAAYEAIDARLVALASGRDLRQGWLGVTLPNEDPLRAAPRLSRVAKDGPADAAGLMAGDTILTLGGVPVDTVWSLRRRMSGLDADSDVEATFARKVEDGSASEITSRCMIRLGLPPVKEAGGESANSATPEKTKKPDEP